MDMCDPISLSNNGRHRRVTESSTKSSNCPSTDDANNRTVRWAPPASTPSTPIRGVESPGTDLADPPTLQTPPSPKLYPYTIADREQSSPALSPLPTPPELRPCNLCGLRIVNSPDTLRWHHSSSACNLLPAPADTASVVDELPPPLIGRYPCVVCLTAIDSVPNLLRHVNRFHYDQSTASLGPLCWPSTPNPPVDFVKCDDCCKFCNGKVGLNIHKSRRGHCVPQDSLARLTPPLFSATYTTPSSPATPTTPASATPSPPRPAPCSPTPTGPR